MYAWPPAARCWKTRTFPLRKSQRNRFCIASRICVYYERQYYCGGGVLHVRTVAKQIVDELDRYYRRPDEGGAVAIALRNRYRRSRLPEKVREEIMPKNIIMIGPTGVGKTEIARRMAKLVDAPFVKVEATKYTEVGYVGRDVESMVRDLAEASIRLVKGRKEQDVRLGAESVAEQRLIDLLVPIKRRQERAAPANPLEALFGQQAQPPALPEMTAEEKETYRSRRDEVAASLRAGKLESTIVEIDVEESPKIRMALCSLGMDINVNDMFGGILPQKRKSATSPFPRPGRSSSSRRWTA